MTFDDRLGTRLSAGLNDLAGTSTPDLRDDILAQTSRTRQRPAWTFLERWLPMTVRTTTFTAAPPLRMALVLLLIGLLAVALAASAAIVGSQVLRDGPPHGRDALPALAMLPTACPPGTTLESGDIATIAGTGVAGSSGDGGPATAAMIQMGQGLAIDGSGSVYFGDGTTVRRVRPDGVIETFASGLAGPSGLAFDPAGNLYLTDVSTIKRIDPAGTITTIAGTGVQGSTGDGGPAIDAQIGAATLAIGPDGSLYFDDTNRYRTIDPAGVIHAFAGTGATGFSGDGGSATEATFGNWPYGQVGVAVAPDGSVYLGDGGNYRIRKVDPSGTISTVVGTGIPGHSGDAGPAVDATIESSPYGLAVDTAGDLYVADWNNGDVRKVDATGIITTVAGSGVGQLNGTGHYSGDCGPATEAQLNGPTSVVDRDGALLIGDSANHRIRMVVP